MKTAIFFLFFTILTWGSVSEGATPLQSLIPQKDLPEGWILADGPQGYTKKTLFERINGQAELFFKYGFQKSVFAIYQNQKDRENQIELDIYDMGSVLHAFGIFSRFRDGDCGDGVEPNSCFEDRSGFFYQGKYFVMLYGTASNPDLLKDWSRFISRKIPDRSAPPKEIGFFPKKGLKPGSVQYFPEGLLGRSFLGRGFQGTYQGKDGVKEPKLFIAIFKNSQEAANALRQYRDDLASNGKIYQFKAETLRGENDHQGEILVIQRKFYLLGASGFNGQEASTLLGKFTQNLNL
jgi:hypothetical protein